MGKKPGKFACLLKRAAMKLPKILSSTLWAPPFLVKYQLLPVFDMPLEPPAFDPELPNTITVEQCSQNEENADWSFILPEIKDVGG